ncbi:MAG: response regulator [Bacteroidota bacterium]|jgi:signal transduction histidine kinase
MSGAGPDERVAVLLVDDQPARLLSYRAILADLGLDLVEAGSGRAALQRLMEREFAAVLLDVNMPDMDGFETAALIHSHPRYERTPIIFVTAVHVTDLDRLKGYELGAFDYVYVPVVPEILRSKVQVLAELYAQRKKLERLNRTLEQANAQLAEANSSLQAQRARELQALNRTLEHANLELAQANAALEEENAERRRAEEALREADRRKDEFLAALSHELRNPLAAIANAVRLVRLSGADTAEHAAARDIAARQVEHLTRLIDDLLDVSRITSGRIALRVARVELGEVVARALEAVQPLADARGQRLAVRLAEPSAAVAGDPVRLAQVVSNLVQNAIKYSGDGTEIEIAAGRSEIDGEPCAFLSVRDSGIGIAADMLPYVFDLFSRAHHARDACDASLGVGLALVRELVALHGGSVQASSPGPGAGAEFVVRLPLAADEAAATPAARLAGEAGPRAAADPRRVLVVDDNRDSAESLAQLLRLFGHEIWQAYTGRDALAAVRARRPDLVLLDIGMPDLSGYEVARQIRAEPSLAATRLIALTGYGSEEDRRRSAAAGFDGHLVKPIDFEDLERILAAPREMSIARSAAA